MAGAKIFTRTNLSENKPFCEQTFAHANLHPCEPSPVRTFIHANLPCEPSMRTFTRANLHPCEPSSMRTSPDPWYDPGTFMTIAEPVNEENRKGEDPSRILPFSIA